MSQTRIKSFPALQLNPRKLRMYLSIALICTPFYGNSYEAEYLFNKGFKRYFAI